MDNGLLHISLKREIPEAMKPRTIAVKGTSSRRTSRAEEGRLSLKTGRLHERRPFRLRNKQTRLSI